MPYTRLTILFDRYLSKSHTEAEKEELAELILSSENGEKVKELLEKAWLTTGSVDDMSEERAAAIFNSILQGNKEAVSFQKGKVKRMNRKWWAVAASIILVLGVGYLVWKPFNKGQINKPIVEVTKDVKAPEINRAMISLPNGDKIYLDSADNGQLAIQGNIRLVKLANGQIAYQTANGELIKEIQYNTLFNPRGSKVMDMTLADGSRVWLNAGSSVTYPVAFVGNERKVTINGEAYFEITPDVTKPFYVSKGEMSVQVLGTHFNVNAYDDEADIKVTLLEGSVKTSIVNGQLAILKPGEQAQVSSNIKVVKGIDIDEVMAWKNGKFQFGEKADIGTIMRQIARWYDVDVEYKGTFTKHFGGSISRDVNVSQVLKVLETTGNVKCKVEGRKVTVMPK